ncbi:hypothetical protein MNV49_000933 [Pseudohyphozyma bogoriensis]|nr:hypothetical protein MNV49_000933 [Pseudohyphozyma bogoriensis]
MCSKDTVVCLANEGVTDFLYTCESHLKDPGFARPAGSPSTPSSTPPTTPSVPQSEIDKVKAEYEDKLARKKEALDAKEKELNAAANKDKSWLSTGISGISSLAASTISQFTPPTPPPPSPPLPVVAPTVFVLHRNIFAMRVDRKKKEWQAKEAKERMKGLSLPSVPGGLPSLKTV